MLKWLVALQGLLVPISTRLPLVQEPTKALLATPSPRLHSPKETMLSHPHLHHQKETLLLVSLLLPKDQYSSFPILHNPKEPPCLHPMMLWIFPRIRRRLPKKKRHHPSPNQGYKSQPPLSEKTTTAIFLPSRAVHRGIHQLTHPSDNPWKILCRANQPRELARLPCRPWTKRTRDPRPAM